MAEFSVGDRLCGTEYNYSGASWKQIAGKVTKITPTGLRVVALVELKEVDVKHHSDGHWCSWYTYEPQWHRPLGDLLYVKPDGTTRGDTVSRYRSWKLMGEEGTVKAYYDAGD